VVVVVVVVVWASMPALAGMACHLLLLSAAQGAHYETAYAAAAAAAAAFALTATALPLCASA
jgi:hypothetical protein